MVTMVKYAVHNPRAKNLGIPSLIKINNIKIKNRTFWKNLGKSH